MNHVHFICPQCRDIFCAAKPEHAQMKDGDKCPNCGQATVITAPEVPGGPLDEYAVLVLSLRERQVVALERIARVMENDNVFRGLGNRGMPA